MASSSSSSLEIENDCGIIKAAADGDPKKLKEKMDEIGDEGKFRRMCDSEIDSYGYNVLHLAAAMDAIDMCKFLVDEVGVDVHVKTHRGATPLIIAVRVGHVVTAEYLIERGADITMPDENGVTPLHTAIKIANKELVIMLLKYGADLTMDSVCGTPLNCAAESGNADIAKILIENDAELNTISKYNGFSPLISAIYLDSVECVEVLVKARADANKVAHGLSPLAHAVEFRSNSCIDALLAGGADVDLVSSFGLRPIEHAVITDNREAIWMLILARPRLMATPNWSLIKFLNSITYDQANKRRDLYIRNFKQNGDDAWDERDYSSAITSYTDAMRYDEDIELLANRSLCWACEGEGEFALFDADLCVKEKPDWGKAHLRVAAAWHLLKRYRMSSDTFKRAFELDPENEEIER